jgi:hypothetical protein
LASIVSSIVISKFLHCSHKCKELLPTKLQFKVDKNSTWRGS